MASKRKHQKATSKALPKIYSFVADCDSFAYFQVKSGTRFFERIATDPNSKVSRPRKLPLVVLNSSNKLGDFPADVNWGNPLVSNTALHAIRHLLGDRNDVIKLGIFQEMEYFAIHVKEIVDALCHEQSKVRFLAGRPFRVEKFVFESKKLNNHHLFKVPESMGQVLVSDEFKNVVKESGLKGALLRKI